MEEGEQGVVGPEAGPLGGERFLDLDDHLGVGEHLVGRTGDGRADLLVGHVAEPGALAGTGFDAHVVAAGHQFSGGGRSKADPSLGVLCLGGDPDVHGSAPSSGGAVMPLMGSTLRSW